MRPTILKRRATDPRIHRMKPEETGPYGTKHDPATPWLSPLPGACSDCERCLCCARCSPST